LCLLRMQPAAGRDPREPHKLPLQRFRAARRCAIRRLLGGAERGEFRRRPLRHFLRRGWRDRLAASRLSPAGVCAGRAFAIHMAGLALTERLMSLTSPPPTTAVRLTTRERDSLALVAEGKTDWEISVILGIAEATVRFHVDNARCKLGAVNRAQAVARLVNQRLI
ncbi:MAG: helix-turn-helix transcriptional regulator, partial [Mesorhizobium sp.]